MAEHIYESNEDGTAVYVNKTMGITDAEPREEIIRCRDCKHFAGAVFGRAGYWCIFLEFGAKPDGFCAWSERA